MSAFSFGEILVINFPFAEATGSKRRPVMVIRDTNDGDLLVAKITTKAYNSQFDHEIREWKFANLLDKSTVRMHKIQTIHVSLVLSKIGMLHVADKKFIRNALANLLLKN